MIWFNGMSACLGSFYANGKLWERFRFIFAQSAGAVEYTDCTSAEG